MRRALILMYHSVGTPPRGVRLQSLYVHPLMFKFQAWYLARCRFHVTGLDEITAVAARQTAADDIVVLTFDDGYTDFHQNAAPVLRRYGLPATVFLVHDLVGTHNVWDREHVRAAKPLMSWEQVHELQEQEVEFHSHSRTHPFLTKLDESALRDELAGSRELLSQRLGRPVEFFCYPYGDHDNTVVQGAEAAGYRAAVTTARGVVGCGDDQFRLRRVPVKWNTHPYLFVHNLRHYR